MERVKLLTAAFPLVGIMMVGCGPEPSPGRPTPSGPSAPPVENLPTARPSPPSTDARSLTAGVRVEGDFSKLSIDDASCPHTQLSHVNTPCQHYDFAAPSTGILRVSLTWDERTEAGGLVAGEIEADPGWLTDTGVYRIVNPKVLRVRVAAGENYRILAFLVTSHLDYYGWLAGPFQLVATME
jgi:hypothetical protein